MKESSHSEEGTTCSKLYPTCRPGLTLKEGTKASEHLLLLSWHSEHNERNLQGKERSLHLTTSAQRLKERDCRPCARDSPKKKYPHFLPIQRRCCSTQGFFGQPYVHMSPKSGEESLSDRRAPSSAIICKPIKAHAFTVSAEMQGPSSIKSARTIGSFFRRKRAHHAARTSLAHSDAWRLCANTRCPTDPHGAKRPPRSASSTNFGEPVPTSLRSILSPAGTHPEPPNISSTAFPKHFKALSRATSRCISSQNVVFAFWVVKNLLPPSCSKGPLPFLTSIWRPCSRCLTHVIVELVQILSFAAFNSFTSCRLHVPKDLCLFDFHLASLLPLPYSCPCRAGTNPLIRCLQFLCRLLGKRHANQRQPRVVSTSAL